MTVVLDPAQVAAADRLATLLDRHGRPRRRQRGVYLHGRPGRGKTMVMDRFFATVDPEHKRRFHFHAFFAELHTAAHRLGSIERAIESLLGAADLVCFDEFHVNDIGDGMLIARLLDALFAQHRTLVVTSNQAPHELLPNPLFHDRFEPSIERILAHLDVVALDGPLDYRTLGARHGSGFGSGAYVLDPSSSPGGDIAIDLGDGRSVRALAVDADAVTFDFADLCGAPTSAADYLRLTRRFRRWTLRAVPRLREVPPDQAMRLVNLIDVLYDADLPCTVHAVAPLAELTAGVPAVPDLARTASRLSETSHIADTAIRTV
ncbi:cell division protein ZapE [Nocardia asteroides]|uniref:cell division protein ZapE n=1 Tax=Nocardia asteroides TaxID=1824 RepID=UPI001E352C55|nr:cell division protein ZapE [Nocardia asteroides]UGT53043.1 cell division protein ZapE [Nocardia asteroides]